MIMRSLASLHEGEIFLRDIRNARMTGRLADCFIGLDSIIGHPPLHSMSRVSLILGDATIPVGHRELVANCDLFANEPVLATRPYQVRSLVLRDHFPTVCRIYRKQDD
jgi:hypothetical protein